MTGVGWRPHWMTLSLDDAMVRPPFWCLLHTTNTTTGGKSHSTLPMVSDLNIYSQQLHLGFWTGHFPSFLLLFVIFCFPVWKGQVSNQLTLWWLRRHLCPPEPLPLLSRARLCISRQVSANAAAATDLPSICPTVHPKPQPFQPALHFISLLDAPAFVLMATYLEQTRPPPYRHCLWVMKLSICHGCLWMEQMHVDFWFDLKLICSALLVFLQVNLRGLELPKKYD